jgi:hypothetical protein
MTAKRTFAIVLLALCAIALAALDARVCKGKPNFAPGESKGYFIWQDGDGWHVRWATKGQPRTFSGAVASDAAFSSCEGTSQGEEDAVILAAPNLIRFESHSSGGVKGFDFTPGPGSLKLSFDLRMDGSPVGVDLVRLGYRGTRPPVVPFVVDPRPL